MAEHPIKGIKYTVTMVKLSASINAIDYHLFRRLIAELAVIHSTKSVTADEIISLFTAFSSRKPKARPTGVLLRGVGGGYRSSASESATTVRNELQSLLVTTEGNKPHAGIPSMELTSLLVNRRIAEIHFATVDGVP